MMPQLGDFFVMRTEHSGLRDELMAACIQWGTDSDVNHAGVYVGIVDGVESIVEARPGGAGYAPLSQYMGSNTRWSGGVGIPQSSPWREFIVHHAKALIGTPYGWGDIIAIALSSKRLGGHVDATASWVRQPWWIKRLARTDRLICSELVDYAYCLAGVHLFSDGR